MFPIYEITFFVFATILIVAATMVIVAHSSVHAVLCLMLAFLSSAVLWMMMQMEFLSLVLVFVYIGAVMTLFLFVVMMLNVSLPNVQKKFVWFLSFGLFSILLLIIAMIIAIKPRYFGVSSTTLPRLSANFGNAKAMGILLYTRYLLPFEIAAVILLVAIIAAITLAFRGKRSDAKSQCVREQLEVTKENRLRVVKMEVEKS